MSSHGAGAIEDDEREYAILRIKYNEGRQSNERRHLRELQTRKAKEDIARIAAANADNVQRYLREATNKELRAELARRGLK